MSKVSVFNDIIKVKGSEKCFENDILFDSKVEAIQKKCIPERVDHLITYLQEKHPDQHEFITELVEFSTKMAVQNSETTEKDKKTVVEPKEAVKTEFDRKSKHEIIFTLPRKSELEIHPKADLMPMQTPEEFLALCEDIQKNGLQEPIILCNDKIIDGRNRYQACIKLNIPITVKKVNLSNESDIQNYVISQNISRRHLNSGQRAVIALNEWDKVEAESMARKRGEDPSGKNSLRGKTSEILAKKYGTNAKYVEWAKELQAKKTKSLDDVLQGSKKLSNIYTAYKSQTRTTTRDIPLITIPEFVFLALIQGDSKPDDLLQHMSKKVQDIAQKALKKGV